MQQRTSCWVGIDLHQEALHYAVFVGDEPEPRAEGQLATHGPGLGKLLARLQREHVVQAVYEASGCGYWLARQMRGWGMGCEVVAPSLIPRRAGDRVKNDRRDARKLATLRRAGLLQMVAVPSPEQEDLRSLVRAREGSRRDRHRARQRILKFLQARRLAFPGPQRRWTQAHRLWLQKVELPADARETLAHYVLEEAHQHELVSGLDVRLGQRALGEPHAGPVARMRCLRGIDTGSAMVLATEVFDMRRFTTPRQFMGWCGYAVEEYCSMDREQRGHITRTGNGRVRRILTEAAWNNAGRPQVSPSLRQRWEGQPPQVVAKARHAMQRLHARWEQLSRRKDARVVVTAVARELAGYVWALWLATPETLSME